MRTGEDKCIHRVAWIVACLPLVATQAAAQYIDTNDCLQCHETGLRQNDFCPSISGAIWAQDDKHRRAFWLLHETDQADPQKGAAKRELVQRILGFELREAFTDERYVRLKESADAEAARKVATVKSCLRCHATWPKEADEKYPRTPPVMLELGVSCQGCHGPGEKWDPPHRRAAWRTVTPEGKAGLDFADCRSPAAKARLCASCHVGNMEQEKFVKHEWYAAGHPPLPSFELASFEAQMPVHWKSVREKGPFLFRDGPPPDEAMVAEETARLQRLGVPPEAIKASYGEANFPEAKAKGLDPLSDLARTKDAIVGGATVLEIYARLMGDYAALAADEKAAWPELALYDCAACHHELRSGLGVSLRPKRRHAPGRPPLATWPLVLAQLAAQQAAGHDPERAEGRWSGVQSPMLQLERATTGRPFGDSAAMRDAARLLAPALKQLGTDAAHSRFDEAAARNAIRVLTDSGKFDANDFYTARQSGWAIREIAKDLGAPDADRLFLDGTDDPLALRLPSGPGRSVMANLDIWLSAAAKYDPEWFRRELKAVEANLLSSGRE